MILQLALDRLSKADCLSVARETEEVVDWIEIGTGVIKEYGMTIVHEMKEAFPEKTVVADMKTCDAGKHEALQAFGAGADISTVMGFSANKTVTDMLDVASQMGKRVMVDLLGVKDRSRINELKDIGVTLVALHHGKDMQTERLGENRDFSLIQRFTGMDIAIAGGIDLNNLPSILPLNPDIVIVGSGIVKMEKRSEAAAKLKELMISYEKHLTAGSE